MEIKDKQRYGKIVEILSTFSKYKKHRVGALLLRDGRIISTGYNGNPMKVSERPIIKNDKNSSSIHAEMNTIIFAARNGISIKGCEIFVSLFPCADCTKHLYQAGIKKIYYLNDFKNEDNYYKKLIKIERVKL